MFPSRCAEVWDPFKDFNYGSSLLKSSTTKFPEEMVSFANARVECKETPEAHVYKVVDIPGLRKEEVKANIEGRVLCISGERSVKREEKSDAWRRVENTSTGKFLRRFKLPPNVKDNEMKTSLENGVFAVTIPK